MYSKQSLLWRKPFHFLFIISSPLLRRLPFFAPGSLPLTLDSPRAPHGNTQAPGPLPPFFFFFSFLAKVFLKVSSLRIKDEKKWPTPRNYFNNWWHIHSVTYCWTLTSWLRQSQALYWEREICLVWPRSGFVCLQLVGKSNLIYEEDRFITWADTWLPSLCCNKRWNRSSGGLGGHQAGFLMTVPSDFQKLSKAGWDDQRALHSR